MSPVITTSTSARRRNRLKVGLLVVGWFALCGGTFAYYTYQQREHVRRTQWAAIGRAEHVRLVVVAEHLLEDDAGPDEWRIEMHDPQMGTAVNRYNRVRTTMRAGDGVDAFRCGPGDYLVPLFDRTETRRAAITRWVCLFIGVIPVLWAVGRMLKAAAGWMSV